MVAEMDGRVLTRAEAAEWLRLSLRTVDTLVRSNRLDVVRVGTRVLVPMRAIDRFLELEMGAEK